MYIHNGLSWNESNASKNYEVEEFDKFEYDNVNNKIFNLVDRINSKARDIQDDVSDVVRGINRLSNKYELCSDYDEYINDMIHVLLLRSEDLSYMNKKILINISDSINSLSNKDAKLLIDIELITNMMKRR